MVNYIFKFLMILTFASYCAGCCIQRNNEPKFKPVELQIHKPSKNEIIKKATVSNKNSLWVDGSIAKAS